MNSIVASQCTSINFDAQALHEAEEAEYQREDQERQNEVNFSLLKICRYSATSSLSILLLIILLLSSDLVIWLGLDLFIRSSDLV